jgi:UDP-glucose 4-epimerase
VTPFAPRVLIVGGLGFIGSNLTARFVKRGANATVLTPSRERHAEQVQEFESAGVRVVEGDLRDRGLVAHLVSDQALVFNLSGQSGAVRSMEDPWTDLDINCRGNLALLEAVREVSPGAKVVLVGSRLQYGRPERLPVSEDETNDPLCLHAIHKQTAEEYVRLYGRLYGIRHTVARVTNPFGPGQPSGRTAYGVINRLIHLALADQVLPIYGDGEQLRDYVYVDDVVEALICLGVAEASDGRVYNVGSGTGTRLVDVAHLIVEIAGGGRVEHIEWPPLAAQIETGDFIADISRIGRDIGWAPAIPLRSGLERTIAMYRSRVAT